MAAVLEDDCALVGNTWLQVLISNAQLAYRFLDCKMQIFIQIRIKIKALSIFDAHQLEIKTKIN